MKNIDLLLENDSLKKEFAIRNLDPYQIFINDPDDIERENRFLKDILDWVNKYSECGGDRKRMEADGYEFPPVEPDYSPDNDWYLFEQWLKGKPLREKIKNRLSPFKTFKSPDQLDEDEIYNELKTLVNRLEEINIVVDFVDELPPRLAYLSLYEILDEEHEFIIEGCWHIDGCSGYCPECVRRPWCEFGNNSCWPEDEKAGTMFLVDAVKDYISPSPVSLQILRKGQTEQDKKHQDIMNEMRDGNDSDDSPPLLTSVDDDDIL